MNKYEKYYYYNREQDEVVECTWDEYVKVYPKFRDSNVIKCDKFSLGNGSTDVDNSYGLKDYTISTICLMKDHGMVQNSTRPLIFETMIFSDDKDYDGYQERYTCLNEAKKRHDEIILQVIRQEGNK
jgi:hypothetical protein